MIYVRVRGRSRASATIRCTSSSGGGCVPRARTSVRASRTAASRNGRSRAETRCIVARISRDQPGGPVHVTAQPGLPVEADPADIELVLGNYLSNARKYGDQGPIEVEVRRGQGWADVSVSDRGPGISDEDADRVFEPFYRGAATRHTPGLGIGLALCRRVMESCHGRVWTKPRPGGGAIFGFSLPLVRPDPIV